MEKTYGTNSFNCMFGDPESMICEATMKTCEMENCDCYNNCESCTHSVEDKNDCNTCNA